MAGTATYISTGTTTQVSTVPCVLNSITVGTTAAGSIIVYDATSGTSNQVCELKSSIAEGTYIFDAKLLNGCRVVTAAASKITVVIS